MRGKHRRARSASLPLAPAAALLTALAGLSPLGATEVEAQAAVVARRVEPVVLTGADLPTWSRIPGIGHANPDPPNQPCDPDTTDCYRDAHNGTVEYEKDPRGGVSVDDIAAFRWNGRGFEEIPVQVDEMFPYFLANERSDFAFYSGTDKELTYEWDVEAWKMTEGQCVKEYAEGDTPMQDPILTLDDDDEVVFMASDAGLKAPATAPGPEESAASRQEIAIHDPLTDETSYVYLFLRGGGSSFNASNGYVRYERDANADEWIDRGSFTAGHPENLGSSNTGYGPNLHGTVCGDDLRTPEVETIRESKDRFPRDGVTVTTDSYRWYASGRWMVREMRVAKPGQPGVYGPDLIDRWKGRAFQQNPDSSISLVGFEDEQVNWEANSSLLGELTGPVRAIREVWGADSGTNVTKTETFYRDAVSYRFRVRVHPIPPDGLYTSWDYNKDVAVKYFNARRPEGVDIDGFPDEEYGNIDENPVNGDPMYFDHPDPRHSSPTALYTWEQVAGANDFGSLVYIWENTGPTTATNPVVVPYYRDDACFDDGTGDNPVPRPWPGEASTDQRVRDGYAAQAGKPYEELTCEEKQGAYGSHGLHAFVTHDTDNLFVGETTTEADIRQWQFAVPSERIENVGEQYANTVLAPLQLTTAAIQQGNQANTAPDAKDVSAETREGIATQVTLEATDEHTCELSFEIVTAPKHGQTGEVSDASCQDGSPKTDAATVTYSPGRNFAGTDSFTYRVSDGQSRTEGTATVSVTDAPAGGGGGGGGGTGGGGGGGATPPAGGPKNDRPGDTPAPVSPEEAKAICSGAPDAAVNHVVGTAGRDIVLGTAGSDVLCGMRGRDTLRGAGGPDVLLGGAGRDLVIGGPGLDACRGERRRSCETRAL